MSALPAAPTFRTPRDVDGWVQYDNQIYPGTTFTPYSTRGGNQYKLTIKYQLYQNNWWFACQGRWIGYYPASLFMGNQSVFSTNGCQSDATPWKANPARRLIIVWYDDVASRRK